MNRTEEVHVRLTPEERTQLEKATKSSKHKTLSAYMRSKALGDVPDPKTTQVPSGTCPSCQKAVDTSDHISEFGLKWHVRCWIEDFKQHLSR